MYTVCYVLTDSSELSFFNETMISIKSLRYYGYLGPVVIVTDQLTYGFLLSQHKVLEDYKVTLSSVDVPEKYNQQEKSRFIKTGLRNYIGGDYLFVDTDTVFSGRLPDFISDSEIAMVTDHHYDSLSIDTPTYSYALPMAKKLGTKLHLGDEYFNSGVAWVKDTEGTHELYRLWHEMWIDRCSKGIFQDQITLNDVNHIMREKITRLDDCYNIQVTGGESIPFSLLGDAIIIHYFHPSRKNMEYLLSFPEIRENHFESDVIKKIIMSPKTAFADGRVLKSDNVQEYREVQNSLQYRSLLKIYKHRRLFSFNESILGFVRRIYKFIRK